MRPTSVLLAAILVLALGQALPAASTERSLTVGSKAFTESHVLAEISAQLLEHNGFTVHRELGLGGTLITYQALRAGDIDLYPEYSGTLAQVILRQPDLARPDQHGPGGGGDSLQAAAADAGLSLPARLGFNNSYALAVPTALARNRDLEDISDLADKPDLRLGFSLEFLRRDDGWPALRAHYALPQRPVGMEHALAYPALAAGRLDVTDAYATDGELTRYDIILLQDDNGFFPAYDALLVARADLPAGAARVLARLNDSVDAGSMRELNRRVSASHVSPRQVAAEFLVDSGLVASAPGREPTHSVRGRWQRIAGYTLTHLKLTGIALGLACLVAIPLALALSRLPRASRALVYLCGLLQTVPSLALLALLIPLLGLGQGPAILALFLYSLLPIVRNTLTGITSVDPVLRQVATGMGMTRLQQLRLVELPLAMPTLLAGIKTAAIISIGTATLAAFVGAGGLGEPIITGLTLNDHRMILEGAVPAALLAVAVELLFEGLERGLLPAHLRRPDGAATR